MSSEERFPKARDDSRGSSKRFPKELLKNLGSSDLLPKEVEKNLERGRCAHWHASYLGSWSLLPKAILENLGSSYSALFPKAIDINRGSSSNLFALSPLKRDISGRPPLLPESVQAAGSHNPDQYVQKEHCCPLKRMVERG